MTRPTAVCIMGPTACGKTDLALALARDYPFEIVSVDSALVYRGMDIGTAKPSPEILARHVHHTLWTSASRANPIRQRTFAPMRCG